MRRIAFILLFAVSAFGKDADILITGGTVITMAGPDIENGSVVISGGKIVAVGASSKIDASYHAKTTIHARGMAVLPGFINTHTHIPMTLFRGIADDRDLNDWLTNFIFPAEAKNVSRDFVKWGTRLGAVEMIQSGTTTFTDMYYFESDIARETKAAGLRGVLGETVIDFPVADNKSFDEAMRYCRAYAKQWKGDRLITPAIAPHAPYTVSEEHLKAIRAFANEEKVPILIHVSETKADIDQVSKAHGTTDGKYLDSINFLGRDVVAAHGVWLTPEEIAIFAQRKTGVAHCPESNMMLASGVAPVVAMRKAGMDVGIGTDGPAGSNNNLDMFEEMASAARLQKVMSGDPKALSARDVLEMATIGGARVLNMEDKIGSLEAGKRADVIVVDLNEAKTQPVYSVESAIVYAADGANVVDTIVDGKIVMRDRKVLTVDVPATLAKAKEIRDKVLASLKK